MSSIFIIEPQYFAPIDVYYTMRFCNILKYEVYENYKKSTFRNRLHIATANGLMQLSVPLQKGKNEQQALKDVKICNQTNWQKQHWKSISLAYKNAAYFEYYIFLIEHVYTKKYEYLIDFTLDCNAIILNILQKKIEVQQTTKFEKIIADTASVDYRNKFDKSIATAYSHEYHQVFIERNGFIKNLSILDFIFNNGSDL